MNSLNQNNLGRATFITLNSTFTQCVWEWANESERNDFSLTRQIMVIIFFFFWFFYFYSTLDRGFNICDGFFLSINCINFTISTLHFSYHCIYRIIWLSAYHLAVHQLQLINIQWLQWKVQFVTWFSSLPYKYQVNSKWSEYNVELVFYYNNNNKRRKKKHSSVFDYSQIANVLASLNAIYWDRHNYSICKWFILIVIIPYDQVFFYTTINVGFRQ